MCTVLSNKPYMVNVSFTYSTWTLFTLPFSGNNLKNFEKRNIFSFFRYQVPYQRSSIRHGFSPVFCSSLLFVEYRHQKFLGLYFLLLIMKVSCIRGGDKPFKNFYSKTFQVILMYFFLLSHFKNVLERTNMVVMN